MWNAGTKPGAHRSELWEASCRGHVYFQKDYVVNTPGFWHTACQAAQVDLKRSNIITLFTLHCCY